MNNIRQHIVTTISVAILLCLTYLLWRSDKNYEYSSLSMSIHIMLGCFLALILGLVAIFKRPYTQTKSIYNFIGTFNVHIAFVGVLFSYVDSGNHLSGQTTIFIVPFIIGFFILENIYFNKL